MKPTVAIITSQFNEAITSEMHARALSCLQEHGFEGEHIIQRFVPGAIEIPIVAQHLAGSGVVDAIIALGVVIRGETDHYDYVCQQVSYGTQKVALDHGIPVIFGVLTTHNRAQAIARADGSKGDKGRYAAEAAVQMLDVLAQPVTPVPA